MTMQSTVASVRNIRKQRQLELELVELDRQWHLELKALARERLGIIKDLCRLQEDQRAAEHFPNTVHGPHLTHLADNAQARLAHLRQAKRIRKFDFQPDPVEKMHLSFPLFKNVGEVVEVRTSKELYNHRVQVQKVTFEQVVADRRSRRRPFWDKAIIGRKKKTLNKNGQAPIRQGFFQHRPPGQGEEEEEEDEAAPQEARFSVEQDFLRRKRDCLSKSPSLPALNSLRRSDLQKPATFHPSLSNRHSASLDYLPVIKDATRGQPGLMTSLSVKEAPSGSSLKAPSVSSVTTLPTIEET